MKSKFIFLLSVVMIFWGCNADDINETILLDELHSSKVCVTNNYLKFSDVEAFENYLDSCVVQKQSETALQKNFCINRFKTLAALEKEFSNANFNIKKSLSDSESDIEEMSEEEFNLLKAENLIYDNSLTYVLDTTLSICINDILYKITPYGTFSVAENDAYKIENEIMNFDTTLSHTMEIGSSIILPSGVEFTKSFNGLCEEKYEDDIVEEKSISKDFAVNNFHNGYNVESYKWKNHSVAQKFVDWMRGKKVSRENNFNKNKRVQVIVYQVNYKFYASTGIKVKVQKRKRFCGVPYWKETSADKVAIGFNGLEAELKYNNPKSYSSITPTLSQGFGSFTKALNNIPVNFVYTWVSKIDFIKDWTKAGVYFIMPEIKINDEFYRQNILNKIYNAEIKEISNLPKNITNKYFSVVKKKIQPTDPIVSYLVWGNSTITFNKERPYITGVETYNASSKSVVFDRSFGITINNKSIGGFLPTQFDINKIDAFGAACCDGKWLGIRFYYE